MKVDSAEDLDALEGVSVKLQTGVSFGNERSVVSFHLHVHVNDENRKKLDAKSEKCVFIGYSEHSKAYQFFNPILHKVVVSRDVIFYEGETWKSQKCHKFVVDDGLVEKNEEHAFKDQGSV